MKIIKKGLSIRISPSGDLTNGESIKYCESCEKHRYILTLPNVYLSSRTVERVLMKLVNKSQHEKRNFVPVSTDSCFGSERIIRKNISFQQSKPDKARSSRLSSENLCSSTGVFFAFKKVKTSLQRGITR